MKLGRFRFLVALTVVLMTLSSGYRMWRTTTLANSKLTIRRSMLAVRSERFDLARDLVHRLLWFDPDHSEALRVVGLSYLGQKNYGEAIRRLSSVSARSPVHRQAHLELVAAMLADYQMDAAELQLRLHIDRYGFDFAPTMQLFGLLMTQLRNQSAGEILMGCIAHPDYQRFSLAQQLEVLTKLARADFDPPSADRSIPALIESFERHSSQLQVALALGRCYRHLGQYDRSDQFLKIACRLSKDGLDATLARAELLHERLSSVAAHDLLDSRSSSDPARNSFDFNFLHSRVLERLGELDDALKFATISLQLKPHDRECHAHIARLFQKRGETERTALHYSRSHELAKNELLIWNASRTLPEAPDPNECVKISDLYLTTGRIEQADAWKLVSLRLQGAPEPQNGSGEVP